MLDLLAPHLTRARDRIVERTRTGTLIAVLDQARRLAGTEVIALDGRGAIAAAGGGALTLLRAYFDGAHGTALPPAIVDWLEAEGDEAIGGRVPLMVSGERGCLTVREAPVRGLDGRVLVLEEQRAVTPASLRSLGLTRRQAEVLALAAAGMGTAEIADALFISPVTVRKHFEHLYERIGVHSRAAAVAVARRSADGLEFARRIDGEADAAAGSRDGAAQ
jgi:DNA-binding CsgD family transcriptional regulator